MFREAASFENVFAVQDSCSSEPNINPSRVVRTINTGQFHHRSVQIQNRLRQQQGCMILKAQI
jgi:hypothetical protein